MYNLMWAEIVLVLLVLFLLPLFFWVRGTTQHEASGDLGLPRGSVRSMLALLVVGSTINVMLFGSEPVGDHFSEVIAALAALSGWVMGFYFAGHTATPHPRNDAGTAPTPEE